MVSVSVTLSDWLWQAVLSRAVLTLSRDYFRLRKPLERRVYEIARKHCGRQPEWRVSLQVLHKKSGSTSPRRVFRRMIRDMIAADTLPDYALAEEPGDVIRVAPRPDPGPDPVLEAAPDPGSCSGSGSGSGSWPGPEAGPGRAAGRRLSAPAPPQLSPDVLEEARRLAPGWDVYALEADWRAYWAASGRPRLGSAAKAYLGYVRARTAGRP